MRQVLIITLLAIVAACGPQPHPADLYECAGNVLVYCLPGRVKSNCEFVGSVSTTEPRNACEAPP